MALYMYQAAYTAESVAAQINEPQDRIEAVKPALEALGGKILVGGYPFGDYDVLAVYEAPDDTAAAAFALAIAAGGAVKSAKTTRLLTGQEWIESLRKAQGSQYRPARYWRWLRCCYRCPTYQRSMVSVWPFQDRLNCQQPGAGTSISEG